MLNYKEAGFKDWFFNLFKKLPKGNTHIPPIGYPYHHLPKPGAPSPGTGLDTRANIGPANPESFLSRMKGMGKQYGPHAAAGAGALGLGYGGGKLLFGGGGGQEGPAPTAPAPEGPALGGMFGPDLGSRSLQNALIGGGIGTAGGALMGLMSNDKKKSRLKSMLESALAGGLGGAAIGGVGTPLVDVASSALGSMKAGSVKADYNQSVNKLLSLMNRR